MIGDEDDIDELDDEVEGEDDDAEDDVEVEGDDDDDIDDDDDDIDDDDDEVDIGGDTVVGLTGEYDIDSLFKMLDSTDPSEVAHRREIRRRLEELAEQREVDLDSTFNFDLDEDL